MRSRNYTLTLKTIRYLDLGMNGLKSFFALYSLNFADKIRHPLRKLYEVRCAGGSAKMKTYRHAKPSHDRYITLGKASNMNSIGSQVISMYEDVAVQNSAQHAILSWSFNFFDSLILGRRLPDLFLAGRCQRKKYHDKHCTIMHYMPYAH